jgi:coenzyme F420-dependent glucose-6-phosphate dehydrogenase
MQIGYHASHEQFAPSRLVELAVQAEAAGFDCIKSSDHFHPWSDRQGQSGFAWSWLGAAMARTTVPFGTITAPGYRYHPAIVAQAAATLGEMFPNRFWVAIGSGENVNESITGLPWPEKAERNRRLGECATVIRQLFSGETVTHRGRIDVIEARLYSRPARPVPIIGAAVTAATARFVASWADGLLTTGTGPQSASRTIAAYREAGGPGPVYVQHALSWAETEDAAWHDAIEQWGPVSAGGDINWDLRRPADFDQIATHATRKQVAGCVSVSSELDRHAEIIAGYAELGVDGVYLHNVGTNQEAFVEAFGRRVLPALR